MELRVELPLLNCFYTLRSSFFKAYVLSSSLKFATMLNHISFLIIYYANWILKNVTLPHLGCLTSLGSDNMLEQYNHLLILCLFLNVISGFLFLRDKKFNKIIASGILSFFLLLSVIRDFQFSLSKLLFLLAKKKSGRTVFWSGPTPITITLLLSMKWLHMKWMEPPDVPSCNPIVCIQPSIPLAPKHRGAPSLAVGIRAPWALPQAARAGGSRGLQIQKGRFRWQESRGIVRTALDWSQGWFAGEDRKI